MPASQVFIFGLLLAVTAVACVGLGIAVLAYSKTMITDDGNLVYTTKIQTLANKTLDNSSANGFTVNQITGASGNVFSVRDSTASLLEVQPYFGVRLSKLTTLRQIIPPLPGIPSGSVATVQLGTNATDFTGLFTATLLPVIGTPTAFTITFRFRYPYPTNNLVVQISPFAEDTGNWISATCDAVVKNTTTDSFQVSGMSNTSNNQLTGWYYTVIALYA